MDGTIKAVQEDLKARGEPATAEAIAERMFVLSLLSVDEPLPRRDAYLERVLPAVRDYLERQRRAKRR